MSTRTIRIQPSSGWAALNLGDLWHYRDLLFILAIRDIKLRYRQTALGICWVVLQPLAAAIIFTIIFGRLATLPSDGLPYLLFAFAGMLPWTLFSQSLLRAGGSLVASSGLISKVYFPRVIIPVASTAAVLVDLGVTLVVMLGLMVYYGVPPGWALLLLPAFVALGLAAAVGVSLWVSALSVQYRDFIHTLPVLVQIWMYASPVVYSTSLIPERWQPIYALNPMVGLIECFRWSLLGRGTLSLPIVGLCLGMSALFLVTGALVFRRMERAFADVI